MVTSPAGPTDMDPAIPRLMGCSAVLSSLPVVSTTEWSPTSRAAPMYQCFQWSGLSFGGELAGHTVPQGSLNSHPTGASPHVGESDADGGRLGVPDLSREGPFDVHQDRPYSGASPRLLDDVQGCQFRMTSYDEEQSGPDFMPAYGVQLHNPRLLEYVGAPESARLLSRIPEYWVHHMGREKTLSAALAAAALRWADTIERAGSSATCDGAESNIVRRDAGRQRSAAISYERYAAGDALIQSSPGSPLYYGDGFVAAIYNFGDLGTSATGDL